MADSRLSTPALTNAPSRRALLGATGLMALGTSVPAFAAPASTPTVNPALSRLIAEHDRADADLNAFYENTWNPAVDAHQATLAAVPHTTVACQGYRNVLGENTPPHVYSTANRSDVARCRGIMSIRRDLQSTDPRWQETYEAARRLTVAVKWREQKIARINRDYAALDLDAQEDAMWEPIKAINAAIRAFPVASIADLAAKLTHLHRIGDADDDAETYHQIAMSGLQSLASGEGR